MDNKSFQKLSNNPPWKFLRQNRVLILAIIYFFLPLDFIPDIIPVFGFGDDILVLLATLFVRYKSFQKAEKEAKGKIIEGQLADE